MIGWRISIEGSGFITEETEKRLLSLPDINRDLVVTGLATLRFANELATTAPAHVPHESPEEKQKVIALVLLVRLIEIVESIFILSAYGVRQELKTLFRVFLDAYFLIANVCSDPQFLQVYFRTDEPNRLKLLNAAARHDHKLFEKVNQYATEEVRTELEQKIKQEKILAFNSYLYAEKVGCSHLYDSMYRLTSSSVHTTPRCLEEYVEADAQGNITRILHKGDIGTVHQMFYDTTWFLLIALNAVSQVFHSTRLSFRM